MMTPVNGPDGLSRLMEEPGAVVVFKHSTRCPVSAWAYREMERVDAPVHVIRVIEERPLSNLLEGKTGIRHESPQVLVLRGGAVVWHASHGGVTAEAVHRALTV